LFFHLSWLTIGVLSIFWPLWIQKNSNSYLHFGIDPFSFFKKVYVYKNTGGNKTTLSKKRKSSMMWYMALLLCNIVEYFLMSVGFQYIMILMNRIYLTNFHW
jgi:hypothetical protein